MLGDLSDLWGGYCRNVGRIKMMFPELADVNICNMLEYNRALAEMGGEVYADGDYPEHELGFWRSAVSPTVGMDVYYSSCCVLVRGRIQSHGDFIARAYRFIDGSVTAEFRAVKVSSGRAKLLDDQKEVDVPVDALEAARACAWLLWQGTMEERSAQAPLFPEAVIGGPARREVSETPPLNLDRCTFLLSSDERIMVVEDDLATYFLMDVMMFS